MANQGLPTIADLAIILLRWNGVKLPRTPHSLVQASDLSLESTSPWLVLDILGTASNTSPGFRVSLTGPGKAAQMPGQREHQAIETTFEPGSRVSDARLVEDARLGDQKAFGELVLRYERRLIRVILRFVRDPDLAEDLAQESFLRVYERLEQYDASRRFGPWLFRIGVNLTLDYLRKRKRRIWGRLFSDSPHEKWPDPAVADPRVTIDLHQEVWQVIEQLAEKYRIVLILRDLEGFSTSEIAAILNRREATIRWRLAEARNRFQELWEKRHRTSASAPHTNTPRSAEVGSGGRAHTSAED